MCCTLLCSRFVVYSQDLVTTTKDPLSSSCSVLLWCFLRKYGKSSREIHGVGKTPPTHPHAQSCRKAYLDSFSAMRHMVCSKNVCVSVLFDVLLPPMTILFVDPNLIDSNCNGHDASP